MVPMLLQKCCCFNEDSGNDIDILIQSTIFLPIINPSGDESGSQNLARYGQEDPFASLHGSQAARVSDF